MHVDDVRSEAVVAIISLCHDHVSSDAESAPVSAMTEEFTAEESRILRCYFTNLDRPVFALMNLPEVVKGALFARYSRSPLSLRRLFLDEFADDLETDTGYNDNATVGLRRAEALYDRVFLEYGDDSVAQLGGVHLACEQASNLLTKVLERGRLMSYLEQSTRYVAYDLLLNGRYRYYRAPEVLASSLGPRYVSDIDGMFSAYSEMVKRMQDFFRTIVRKSSGDSDTAYRRAIRARALDAARGMLPAAALSNVGIYGSGQAYEALLMRMESSFSARGQGILRSDADRTPAGDPVVPQTGRPARSGSDHHTLLGR